jgi:hypothetical protein
MNCRSSAPVLGQNEISDWAAPEPPTVKSLGNIDDFVHSDKVSDEYSKDFSEILSEIGEITP